MTSASEYAKGKSPGEVLKQARLERQLSIAELAEITCLNEQIIEWLEQDDWLALPAMVYVRGYVRIICRELSLDPKDALRRLDVQSGRLNEPIAIVTSDEGFWHSIWERRRPTLAVGVVVATVLIGLLSHMISVPQSSEDLESETRMNDQLQQQK